MRGVIEMKDEVWRFSHDKLREGLLLNLPAHEQRRLHRHIAEALEQFYDSELPQILSTSRPPLEPGD